MNTNSLKKTAFSSVGGFTVSTVSGSNIVIEDRDSDGKPAVGDLVTDESGQPVRSQTLMIQTDRFGDRQTEITTDQDGKITKIKALIPAAAMQRFQKAKVKEAFGKMKLKIYELKAAVGRKSI